MDKEKRDAIIGFVASYGEVHVQEVARRVSDWKKTTVGFVPRGWSAKTLDRDIYRLVNGADGVDCLALSGPGRIKIFNPCKLERCLA